MDMGTIIIKVQKLSQLAWIELKVHCGGSFEDANILLFWYATCESDVNIIGFVMSFQNLRLNAQRDLQTTPSWSNTIYENYHEEKSENYDNDWTRGLKLVNDIDEFSGELFLVCFQL